METAQIKNYNNIFLTQEQFSKLSIMINRDYGIKLPVEKKIMLQSRLQKRLRELNLDNFEDYVKLVFRENKNNSEIINMIDLVTTNKTDFFRESSHFDYLVENILPIWNHRHVRIWSAGCSSGEECYTLAIFLKEYSNSGSALDFHIHGTDISTRILSKAEKAIYPEEKIDVIPIELRRKYFLRSKDRSAKTVKVIGALQKKVSFSRLNFMDSEYNLQATFDIIFCRNVLIYFDRSIQEIVINRLCRKLKAGGFLFLGHSESIIGLNVPLMQVKPTIYKKV